MALSANATYTIRDTKQVAVQGLEAEEFYNGSLLQVHSRSHADNGGRAEAWILEDGAIPMGFATTRTTGDTSELVEATMDLAGRVIKVLAVTGLAGTVADNMRLVYASDDGTFTLTRAAMDHPVGIVSKFSTATVADVLFFSFETLCAIGMAGAGRGALWNLGTISGIVSTGNLLTGIEAPCHGRITSVYGIVLEPQTDADADGDINLEIEGTNVTGGVIEWVTADAIGAKKAGTAITAEDVFHEGDLIDVECVENTAGTAADGYMTIYANVLTEPGL
ncbi:hypothetical protein [uncultured Mediterranean phage]|nr:hypothetical protein [uncultured Mediterranean phage]